ncbi:HAD-IA family hydrolase [Cyanobium sp. HWJ4-Hawea]|uniref:HAD family hydrolase n=1 Tax=Cyanobium sp. HWJ4-Hawea TaxID=2823713 RepID=UPI0020CE4D17|nr:HAD-IA family hydrolase [Cyanobium sp. HWJ4-Hawea]MCP9809886.1 HAD-IA family hydrolase [Cyanobium sp. HWJ4-Hawea]
MAEILLRGTNLGPVSGVLFDKDGTLSLSEAKLITLAKARVFLCLQRVDPGQQPELQNLLERAYGLSACGTLLHPAGTTAVAHRDHNLISTATALAQVGLGWPEALATSEAVFAEADANAEADGQRRPHGRPTSDTTAGLLPLLSQLQAAGVLCAVISNDDVAGIEHFLGSHQLRPFFAGIWSAEHRPRKPDPGAIHGLCAELGLAVEQCLLIGDANSDLQMAVAAGIPQHRSLGYTAAWSTPPPLAESHPLIYHWNELTVLAAPGK